MSAISSESVHEALLCLYVPTELANSELARLLPEIADIPDVVHRAQALRVRLLDAIEMLRPAGHSVPLASASRAYDCLRLRHVSGFEVTDVARQLSLSRRQAYRDLRWGEEQLALLLQSRQRVAPVQATCEMPSAMEQEIKALVAKPEAIHLAEVVESAVAIVAPLAQRQGATIRLEKPRRHLLVFAVPAILREVITLLLSAVLQAGAAGDIRVRLDADDNVATVKLPTLPASESAKAGLTEAALQVISAQKWQADVVPGPKDSLFHLSLPLAKRRHVLIVEDNPGAYALYERYLASSKWSAVLAPHPRLAVDLAVAKEVEAIILDLMMAETDGWTLLQTLRLNQRTRSIPVIICSVVNDPELGLALGATACLTKPISRLDLLKTLRQVVHESKRDQYDAG
ncbi:MAG: response regulator [Anaerolineae bacterium]